MIEDDCQAVLCVALVENPQHLLYRCRILRLAHRPCCAHVNVRCIVVWEFRTAPNNVCTWITGDSLRHLCRNRASLGKAELLEVF